MSPTIAVVLAIPWMLRFALMKVRSIFLHLVPIYSALLAGAVLGESLMSYHVIGFALILAGVYCAARSPGELR